MFKINQRVFQNLLNMIFLQHTNYLYVLFFCHAWEPAEICVLGGWHQIPICSSLGLDQFGKMEFSFRKGAKTSRRLTTNTFDAEWGLLKKHSSIVLGVFDLEFRVVYIFWIFVGKFIHFFLFVIIKISNFIVNTWLNYKKT